MIKLFKNKRRKKFNLNQKRRREKIVGERERKNKK